MQTVIKVHQNDDSFYSVSQQQKEKAYVEHAIFIVTFG